MTRLMTTLAVIIIPVIADEYKEPKKDVKGRVINVGTKPTS